MPNFDAIALDLTPLFITATYLQFSRWSIIIRMHPSGLVAFFKIGLLCDNLYIHFNVKKGVGHKIGHQMQKLSYGEI